MTTFFIIYGAIALISSVAALIYLIKLDRASWPYDGFGIRVCTLAATVIGVFWPIVLVLFGIGLAITTFERKKLPKNNEANDLDS